MKVEFRMNTIEEEKMVIEDAMANLDFFKENGYIVVLPKDDLEKEYDIHSYQKVAENIISKWREIEDRFFERIKLLFKIDNDQIFYVNFTKYGVGGGYELPNFIICNIGEEYRKMVFYTTIGHEIVHLFIEEYVRKNNIPHQTKEELVAFIERELVKIY
jgi:hypothetical protein